MPESPRRPPSAAGLTLAVCGVVLAAVVLARPAGPAPADLRGLVPDPFAGGADGLRREFVEASARRVTPSWPRGSPWRRACSSARRGRGWVGRLVGWTMLLAVAAVWADWIGSERLGGPLVGAGGSVGAALANLLGDHFTRAGGIIVFVGVLAAGLLVAADGVVMGVGRGALAVGRPRRAAVRDPPAVAAVEPATPAAVPPTSVPARSKSAPVAPPADGSIPIHHHAAVPLPAAKADPAPAAIRRLRAAR